jgi:2-succinyl-5-enolpyruvyl-6-hydroxy-3-cyclohexene-1-carboxylate synthase
VLLVGDVALAHDIGGLLACRRLGLKLTIVLLENGGGGIFDFLAVSRSSMTRTAEPRSEGGPEPPGAEEEPDIYTLHVATPTGLDFSQAASLYGLSHERVEDVYAFRAALERSLDAEQSTLIEVPGDRAANVRLHRHIWDAVARSLNPPAAEAAPTA